MGKKSGGANAGEGAQNQPKEPRAPRVRYGGDKSLVFTKKGEAVDVLKGDTYIRTFSEKKHGKDFEEIAEQFVRGRKDGEYQIVDSSTVPAVKVLYRERNEDGVYVDRTRVFKDKREAHFFNTEVHGTIVVAQ